MNFSLRSGVAAAGLALVGVVGLSACSSDSDAQSANTTSPAVAPMTDMTTTEAADPAANLVGPGCAAYAEQVPTGPGSIAGMAQDPVATAAANNPLLTTLTSALSGQLNPEVNLVDTLNGDQFTVFAPTDEAFAKLPPSTVETLKTDSELLSSILTYHVVPGQAAPADVPGEHQTVQGAPVTVTGAGDQLRVNEAGLVCGGVQTANATVYLIDSVLMPPAN